MGQSSSIELVYIVIDNTRLINLGKKLRPTIKFVDSEDSMGSFFESRDADILFMSSVLHYISDWNRFLLRIVKESGPILLYIARHYSPTHSMSPIYATQKIHTPSGYAGEVVLHLIPESYIIEILSDKYGLVFSAIADDPKYFPSSFDTMNIQEKNLLFRRKNAKI